jgi:hypothetical protein
MVKIIGNHSLPSGSAKTSNITFTGINFESATDPGTIFSSAINTSRLCFFFCSIEQTTDGYFIDFTGSNRVGLTFFRMTSATGTGDMGLANLPSTTSGISDVRINASLISNRQATSYPCNFGEAVVKMEGTLFANESTYNGALTLTGCELFRTQTIQASGSFFINGCQFDGEGSPDITLTNGCTGIISNCVFDESITGTCTALGFYSNTCPSGFSLPGTITLSSTDDNFSRSFVTANAAAALDISGTTIAGSGTDADVDITLTPKGTGTVNIDYATQYAVPFYEASGALDEVGPLTDGQLVIGATGAAPAAGSITSSGGSITVTPGTNTVDLAVASPATLTWNVETGTSANMAVNNGYIANNAGTVTFSLPASAAVGDRFVVTGLQGTWVVDQQTGQTIHFGASSTTTTSGSLTSTNARDTVWIICVVANTDFQVISSIGNITVA